MSEAVTLILGVMGWALFLLSGALYVSVCKQNSALRRDVATSAEIADENRRLANKAFADARTADMRAQAAERRASEIVETERERADAMVATYHRRLREAAKCVNALVGRLNPKAPSEIHATFIALDRALGISRPSRPDLKEAS